MKFTIALVATTFVANAANLTTEGGEHGFQGKPSFSIGNHYQAPDYTQEYGEVLPGADFNKQVYNFDEKKAIWDQNDYEERVKMEAEILVALEALKSSVSYIDYDIVSIDERIQYQRSRIGANQDDIYTDLAALKEQYYAVSQTIAGTQDFCRGAQDDIDTNKAALVLYCQQFAFAKEMNHACANLLTCRDTQLSYKWQFTGDVHPQGYGHDEPQSTHGIKLHQTGGHVQTADPHADPELAAAAISPYHAVIQVNGESIPAPIDKIDPSKVELACDDTGCTLIPDDGNPHNDIHPHGQHDHGHHQQYEPEINHGNHGHHGHHEPEPAPYHPESSSTHGIHLPMVGGNAYVDPSVNPELAAAAYNDKEAVIVHNGEAFLAPIQAINPDSVELACNQDGCALIKDDGNPHNDIHPHGQHEHHDLHHY